MNCKPKDIARVIDNDETRHYGTADKIVRVMESFIGNGGLPAWVLEEEIETKFGTIYALSDRLLRPIRDPGDDAVDETLLRLPAPSTHRETEAA